MLPWALDIFDGIWAKKQHKICQLVIYENHGEKKKNQCFSQIDKDATHEEKN